MILPNENEVTRTTPKKTHKQRSKKAPSEMPPSKITGRVTYSIFDCRNATAMHRPLNKA